LYDRLFTVENPAADKDFHEHLNPNSKISLGECYAEPGLADAKMGEVFQFERLGYFCINSVDEKGKVLGVHRVVNLKDTWSKK